MLCRLKKPFFAKPMKSRDHRAKYCAPALPRQFLVRDVHVIAIGAVCQLSNCCSVAGVARGSEGRVVECCLTVVGDRLWPKFVYSQIKTQFQKCDFPKILGLVYDLQIMRLI